MPTKAVQQFMLGTVLSNENEACQTLAAMKAAGYDGIELCGFMIHIANQSSNDFLEMRIA